MKIYPIKKENYLKILAILVILSYCIWYFITIIYSDETIIEEIMTRDKIGNGSIIALFLISIYSIFKKPEGYKAKLIQKEVKMLGSKPITYMKFDIDNEQITRKSIPNTYECYAFGENALINGNDYILKIKESIWIPKYVSEIDTFYDKDSTSKASNKPSIKLIFIFLCMNWSVFQTILEIILQYEPTYNIMYYYTVYIMLFLMFEKERKNIEKIKQNNSIKSNENETSEESNENETNEESKN